MAEVLTEDGLLVGLIVEEKPQEEKAEKPVKKTAKKSK